MHNNHNVIYGNLFFIHYQNKGKIAETHFIILISCNLAKDEIRHIMEKYSSTHYCLLKRNWNRQKPSIWFPLRIYIACNLQIIFHNHMHKKSLCCRMKVFKYIDHYSLLLNTNEKILISINAIFVLVYIFCVEKINTC